MFCISAKRLRHTTRILHRTTIKWDTSSRRVTRIYSV